MIIPFECKKDAAKYLNISVCSLNELIKIKDIEVKGKNDCRYFDVIELDKYKEAFNENYQKLLDIENYKGHTIIVSNIPVECIEHIEKQRLLTNKSRSRQIVNMIRKEMKEKEQEAILKNQNN